jgi:hypothetical protein
MRWRCVQRLGCGTYRRRWLAALLGGRRSREASQRAEAGRWGRALRAAWARCSWSRCGRESLFAALELRGAGELTASVAPCVVAWLRCLVVKDDQ